MSSSEEALCPVVGTGSSNPPTEQPVTFLHNGIPYEGAISSRDPGVVVRRIEDDHIVQFPIENVDGWLKGWGHAQRQALVAWWALIRDDPAAE